MTNPLSVSASIAGLITLAEIVFRRTRSYVRAFKNAPKDMLTLSSEIGALFGVLRSVSLVIYELEAETFESTLRMHHVYSTYQPLEKIRVKLDKDEVSLKGGRYVEELEKRLQWPFTSSEVEALISELGRHKQTLGLALNADRMLGLLRALFRQDEVASGVQDVQILLKENHEAETRIAISSERQRILKWLRRDRSSKEPQNESQTLTSRYRTMVDREPGIAGLAHWRE